MSGTSGEGVHVDFELLNEVLQGTENSVDGIQSASQTIKNLEGDVRGAVAGVDVAAIVSVTNELTERWATLSAKAAQDGATTVANARDAAKTIGDTDQKLKAIIVSGVQA